MKRAVEFTVRDSRFVSCFHVVTDAVVWGCQCCKGRFDARSRPIQLDRIQLLAQKDAFDYEQRVSKIFSYQREVRAEAGDACARC